MQHRCTFLLGTTGERESLVHKCKCWLCPHLPPPLPHCLLSFSVRKRRRVRVSACWRSSSRPKSWSCFSWGQRWRPAKVQVERAGLHSLYTSSTSVAVRKCMRQSRYCTVSNLNDLCSSYVYSSTILRYFIYCLILVLHYISEGIIVHCFVQSACGCLL